MQLEDKIQELYIQYQRTHNPIKKKELYKAIKRAEGRRRKEKVKEVIII